MTLRRPFAMKPLAIVVLTVAPVAFASACAMDQPPTEMVGVEDASSNEQLQVDTASGDGEPQLGEALSADSLMDDMAADPEGSFDVAALLADLASMPIQEKASTSGFDAELFAWGDDVDANGCDTRNDILGRDVTEKTYTPDSNDCVVLTGQLHSAYSGSQVDFDGSQASVAIDHVVSLSDAWQSGAAQWSALLRTEFANDPANLVAVEAHVSEDKNAADASAWLPPNESRHCWYVAQQLTVKKTYDLWLTPDERDAMERVLRDCDSTPRQDALQSVTVQPLDMTTPQPDDGDAPNLMPVSPNDEYSGSPGSGPAGSGPVQSGPDEPTAVTPTTPAGQQSMTRTSQDAPDREPQLRPDAGSGPGSKPRPNPASGGSQPGSATTQPVAGL